jgi:site-specific DNA recombinase
LRAAIYARVSTDKQERQATIASQLADVRQAIADAGSVLVREYMDDGYSGELLDRPDLDRLRDDAKQKAFEELWIHSPDRLSRKFIHQGLLQEEITRHGIRIVYFNRPEAKDTPEERLLENVQGVIAEYEKAKILERTRRGKTHKARNGFVVGGWAPYGYRYVPGDRNQSEPGHYEIMLDEAKVARLIFRLLVHEALSVRAIARELTRRGVPPQRGKHWRTSTIHRILRNTTYIGLTYYYKHMAVEPENGNNGNPYRRRKNACQRLRPKSEWIPIPLSESLRIIDEKTFQQAQRQLIANAEQSPRNTRHEYLLRGFLRCGNCDSPLYGSPCHGRFYYVCGNRQRTFPLKRECPVGAVSADPLENAVWAKICEVIANPALILAQMDKLQAKARRGQVVIRSELERMDKAVAVTELEEGRLLDAYREKVISMGQLRDQMAKVSDKRKRLNEERGALATKLDGSVPDGLDKDAAARYCDMVGKRLEILSGDFEGKRRILGLLVSKIVLQGKTVRIRGIIPAVSAQAEPASCHIASLSS